MQADVEIQVRFFAGAAELAGCRDATIRAPRGIRLPMVTQMLIEQFPGLDRMAAQSRWAVANEFVDEEFAFEDIAVCLAMIPPVSGG